MTDAAIAEDTLGFITRNAKYLGREVMLHACKLWYALQAPTTPAYVKAPLIGALAYLGLPFDVVPDFVPFGGFTDDLSVMAGALAVAHLYITDEVVQKAKAMVARIFG